MAEGRMLKKKISLNEALADLENDTHRLLFTWAIPHLDIEGRIPGSPRVFKASVAPLLDHLTSEKVNKFFTDAHSKGLINRYKVDGEWWIEYPKFKENQNLRDSREAASKIPPPPDNSGTTPGVIQDNSGITPAEEKRREEKGSLREEKGRQDASPPPNGGNGDATPFYSCQFFDVSREYREKLAQEYPAMTDPLLVSEFSKMEDWLIDNPKPKRATGKLKNARLFIRNWLSRTVINPQDVKLSPNKADQVTMGNLAAGARLREKWKAKEQS